MAWGRTLRTSNWRLPTPFPPLLLRPTLKPAAMTETSDNQANSSTLSVTVWETIAIVAGAVLLVAIGLVGLMYKFFSNAADPQRAAVIANSLMEYQIPGGVQGVFGSNLGGAKVAIVSSATFPQDPAQLTAADVASLSGVELFIARVPLDVETMATPIPTPEPSPPTDPFSSPDFSFSYRSGEDFQVASTRTEELKFCNDVVPVRIQTGELILSADLPPVAAIKYDAIAIFENSKRQVTLTAIGQDADQQAAQVFNSLRCK